MFARLVFRLSLFPPFILYFCFRDFNTGTTKIPCLNKCYLHSVINCTNPSISIVFSQVDMAKKRSESVLPLIGSPIEEILGSKLPSNGDILRHFMYHHKTLKKADLSSAQAVIFRVQEFWNRARIPTITAKSATRKVLALKEEWRVIQKSAKRKGPTQEKKEQEFSEKLNNLFDIASADALEVSF